ncbi:MAG: tripartite tricarboxylate transporter substrate-binding protein [Hydrogenophaga sp.]|uniref:tripartite tricarboxylate transporter substrate-binding protein n=1 Tax=Hydrogenophaga sp. TaxID=1904254 RepID=UPI002627BD4D|nr:tripartite tricarboxylate transporter substrate-binding protein [Hydrogenophaga sp.]MDD3786998.1 tripartite tricarboxylate transporter substrate-binding protein [Hydrogenophaga sp.]
MDFTRRDFVRMTTLAAAVSGLGLAHAQQRMLDQLKIMVGFPPGGGTDTVARKVADGLRGVYAQTVVVENKPGAAARLAVEDVRRGPADGSVMTVQPDSVMTVQPHTDPRHTPYKYTDLTPVSGVVVFPQAFTVGPAVPASVKTMQDFLAWAKANPDRANFGSPGTNSPQEMMMKAAGMNHGFELTHLPYKGSAPGMQDLVGGQISAMLSPVGDCLPYLADGKVRVLGTSGASRSKFVPDAPTFNEMGFKGMELTEGFGVWVKAGVPEAEMERLYASVQKILAQQDVVDFFGKVGMEMNVMSRQAFVKSMQDSHDAWAERVRIINGGKPAA